MISPDLVFFIVYAVGNYAPDGAVVTNGASRSRRSFEASAAGQRPYNQFMTAFEENREVLEHYETMMGVPRGRLAVTMDMITDAMALVGQHGVYCRSQRWPGKPVMDIQVVMKNLTDAKELIQSVMEEIKNAQG
ncbi:MAG: hypothetical protein NVS1B11_23770 [Terriglobales bacterium]